MVKKLISGNLPGENHLTPDEAWAQPQAGHWYDGAADFAVSELGRGDGYECLVVGSPLFEAKRLVANGWAVTYADIRQPPEPLPFPSVLADISQLPFASGRFLAISSTCVLCHVGLGRYGDRVQDDGDVAALQELARVAQPEAALAIMFGPCFPGLTETVVLGKVHRIYRPGDVYRLASLAGLDVERQALWCEGRWLDAAGVRERRRLDKAARATDSIPYCYLGALLRNGG